MIEPPIAKKKPHFSEYHGVRREDDYFWLREKENEEVIAYLKEENAYTDAVMADTKELQEDLFTELRGRIQENDTSAPVKIDDFYYYTRTEEGKEYPIYCRKAHSLDGEEEILLDQNELAKTYEHCAFGVFAVSPNHRLLAYSVDTTGSELYTIFVKDLAHNVLLPEEIERTSPGLEWMSDSSAFIYVAPDDMLRPSKVYAHTLGTPTDRLLYEEHDERFFMGLHKSRSKEYIFIELGSKLTSEVWFLRADDPAYTLHCVEEREQGHEYGIDHHGDSFYVITNSEAPNFRLMKTPVVTPQKEYWEEVIPHRDDVYLDGIDLFLHHLIVYEMREGVVRVRIEDLHEPARSHHIQFDEETYLVYGSGNPDFKTTTFRYTYSSPVTPPSVYEYDLVTRERRLIKQKEVQGGYDPSRYETVRMYAMADDGEQIPISIAYKKGLVKDGSAPCWLNGYGSYGMVYHPEFSQHRISLLDRGFVYAIAHIRGGGEKGRSWYDDGKFLFKQNTFNDYVRVAETLIAEGYTSNETLIACGRSAGGLLMGAVANVRPDLFKAIIAGVPFVDVVNTMMDPSIPLTVTEYEEWGNPNEREYFEYMLSYSPYDNVAKQQYPHILVTAGLNDPRVQYWEPAKWVAKLRTLKLGTNLLLLKTEMDQGHMGATGRYAFLKEIAFEYAFVLKVLGRMK